MPPLDLPEHRYGVEEWILVQLGELLDDAAAPAAHGQGGVVTGPDAELLSNLPPRDRQQAPAHTAPTQAEVA